MSALVVLLIGLSAGVVVRHRYRLPPDAPQVINIWLLDVALPALVLHALHGLTFPSSIGLLVAAPYLLMLLTVAGYLLAARVLGLSREVVTALVATTAVANTSFVGIPMVTAFFGASSVPVAVIVDQLGSFLLLNTVVLSSVTIVAGASVPRRELLRRVLTAPALLALLASLALRPVTFPDWLDDALAALGATLTPLALFSIGLLLDIRAARTWWRELALGLSVKLVLAPAAVVGLYALAGTLGDRDVRVALFEIAMPPMVTGALIAARHDLANPLPSLLVGVGVPLSFVTLTLWSVILGA